MAGHRALLLQLLSEAVALPAFISCLVCIPLMPSPSVCACPCLRPPRPGSARSPAIDRYWCQV